MELKPGYKQTEVGVIPEDWEVTTIGTVCELSSGTTPSRTLRERYYRNGTIAWVKTLDLNNSEIYSTEENITETALRETSLRVYPAGTVLVAMYGGFNQIGRTGLLRVPATVNQAITAIRPNKSSLLSEYLLRNLNYRISYWKSVASSSRKDPNITSKDIRDFPIACPKPKEQEAIAEALSDADTLIESLEQLITKKRQVKQGAMQELLRPNGGWEMISLGSIADPNQRWSFTGGPFGSNLKSSDYTNEGVRIIQLQNIGDGEFKDEYAINTSPQKADELLSCNIYPGDIILSKMGDPVARACIIPAYRDRYLMCSDGIRLAVDQKRFNTYFVCTLINAPNFRAKAENAGTGSTRKRIGLTELRNLELLCPPLSEQKAIAAILSDMDAEITALEEKLAKARQIKQGMMQELLTGRTRLR